MNNNESIDLDIIYKAVVLELALSQLDKARLRIKELEDLVEIGIAFAQSSVSRSSPNSNMNIKARLWKEKAKQVAMVPKENRK